jgi:hypothetical protein
MNERLALFPDTTRVIRDSRGIDSLSIAGCDVAELAATFGTPLYLFDEATLDARVQAYRAALRAHYSGASAITLAGKALLMRASAQWAARRGLWLDCTGAGEMAIAAAADFPSERLLVHGVNKSDEDLRAALESAAVIVVDNLSELRRLLALTRDSSAPTPALWLRVRPGVAVEAARRRRRYGCACVRVWPLKRTHTVRLVNRTASSEWIPTRSRRQCACALRPVRPWKASTSTRGRTSTMLRQLVRALRPYLTWSLRSVTKQAGCRRCFPLGAGGAFHITKTTCPTRPSKRTCALWRMRSPPAALCADWPCPDFTWSLDAALWHKRVWQSIALVR